MSNIVYKSPVLLAFKIIGLEILVEIAYLFIGTIVQLIAGQLGYEVRFLSPLAQLLLLPLQITILVSMLVRWSSETYEIEGEEIIVRQGIVNKTEKAYPYNNMQSVIVKQSPLERLVGAGTVSVFVPTLGMDLIFSEVPNPKKFAEQIKRAMPYSQKNQFIIRK